MCQNTNGSSMCQNTNGPSMCQNTNGPSMWQNNDGSFKNSERSSCGQKRYLSKSCFSRELHNGEFVNHEWLLHSLSTGSVFCFACTLFSCTHSDFSTFGFDNWKNASKYLSGHENGSEHYKNMLTYSSRQKESGQLDTILLKQFYNVQLYWQNVLKRIVAVVKFLSSRGLSFRGNNETIGSEQNVSYLGTLELLSQFDPFLHEHIQKHGNFGKGNASYLSANICEEFICLMGNKALFEIISESKKAKYSQSVLTQLQTCCMWVS